MIWLLLLFLALTAVVCVLIVVLDRATGAEMDAITKPKTEFGPLHSDCPTCDANAQVAAWKRANS